MRHLWKIAAGLIILFPLYMAAVDAQVSNPGVVQQGPVVANNLALWAGQGKIKDGGAPPTGTVASVSITSPDSSITMGGAASPCVGPACAFTVQVAPIPFSAITGQITLAQMPNASALAVLGRSANSAGVYADIQCAAAGNGVLRESGSVLGCGPINGGTSISAATITYSRLNNAAANTVMANGTSASATLTAFAMPSCSTANSSALQWLTNTGFQCGTITGMPSTASTGAIAYWNGSAWTALAGNSGAIRVLQEDAAGVPSWVAAGAGTVTNVGTAGLATGGPITGTGTVTVTAATKAEQEAAASSTVAVTPANFKNSDFAAKAWCTWNGTTAGTNACIAGAGVTNVTKTATGLYDINFSTSFSSATSYSCQVTSASPGVTGFISSLTASVASLRYTLSAGATNTDATGHIVCFGRQ